MILDIRQILIDNIGTFMSTYKYRGVTYTKVVATIPELIALSSSMDKDKVYKAFYSPYFLLLTQSKCYKPLKSKKRGCISVDSMIGLWMNEHANTVTLCLQNLEMYMNGPYYKEV